MWLAFMDNSWAGGFFFLLSQYKCIHSSEKIGFYALSATRTHVSLVASQACYPLHHQDSPCWQHSELTRCIWIAVMFLPGAQMWYIFCYPQMIVAYPASRDLSNGHEEWVISTCWVRLRCNHYFGPAITGLVGCPLRIMLCICRAGWRNLSVRYRPTVLNDSGKTCTGYRLDCAARLCLIPAFQESGTRWFTILQ